MIYNKNGQGALEYLLLLGGAVLIAVIVIALLISTGAPNNKNAQEKARAAQSSIGSVAVAPIIYSTGCDIPSGVNNMDIEYNGGQLTATLDGFPANVSNHPTQPGHAEIFITDLCSGVGSKTVILTSTISATNSSASTTYVFMDNQSQDPP